MKRIRDISPVLPKNIFNSGPVRELSDGQPGKGTSGRLFQNIWVAFQDLGDAGTACGLCDSGEGACRMVMCLNGDLRFSVTGTDHVEDFLVCAGSCSLQYHPGDCHYLAYARQGRAQLLELVFPAKEFVQLVGDTPLGRELEAAMHSGRPLNIHQPMTTGVHQALVALSEAVPGAAAGVAPMVLAKALELVGLLANSRGLATPKLVSESSRRAVEKAQSILEGNMADPPALGDLAAEIGMSLSKLKLVFLEVCGMPPYAYLRWVRMERAGQLLRDRGMSVTEAAFEVGYSNLSHFAKAFAGHHGINPSQAQRGR
jgi:AraC-like DNA-binding protein